MTTQIQINGRTYNVTDCTKCTGTGRHYDITCADKINAGPFANQCPTCSGRGTVHTYVPTADQAAYRARTVADARQAFTANTSPEYVAAAIADIYGD